MFNFWTLDIDENDDHEGDANVVDVVVYARGDEDESESDDDE